MSGLKKELELDEHIVSLDELYKRYGTDINKGLTTAQVSFSSCQRNWIKTFQIEGMIALITKMALTFMEGCN